jgi:hypothetical protein
VFSSALLFISLFSMCMRLFDDAGYIQMNVSYARRCLLLFFVFFSRHLSWRRAIASYVPIRVPSRTTDWMMRTHIHPSSHSYVRIRVKGPLPDGKHRFLLACSLSVDRYVAGQRTVRQSSRRDWK